MTVTIHKPLGCPPQVMADLTRRLVQLAGGDRAAVRSGHGGLVVSDRLALAYLTSATPPQEVPDSDAQPASMVVPPNLARVIRNAEGVGGLTTPRQPAAPADPSAPKKSANKVVRRRAARVQEPDHV